MGIEFKKDPYLLAFAAVVVVCMTALVWHGDITLKEAGAVASAALLSPGLLGRKAATKTEKKEDAKEEEIDP